MGDELGCKIELNTRQDSSINFDLKKIKGLFWGNDIL